MTSDEMWVAFFITLTVCITVYHCFKAWLKYRVECKGHGRNG